MEAKAAVIPTHTQAKKEQAKLSAIEQAHLEVETYENRVELLRSVHKEQGEVWDWPAVAASLPPPRPQKRSHHEQRANQCFAVLPPKKKDAGKSMLEQARLQDEQDFQGAVQSYSEQLAEWETLKNMARRILAGEYKAYAEALVEFNPFVEISDFGSSINFTVHSARLVECVLKVKGTQIIPAEVKTLTASEKVSVKPMPKGRFHELYQNHICGCLLRMAREIFALLPVESLLVTAAADWLDPRTGQAVEQPVLSVFMPRAVLTRLDFDQLDPSHAMDQFHHRGDFKASRKLEAFQPIAPLAPADIVQLSNEEPGFDELLANVQRMSEELKSQIAELSGRASDTILQSSSSL